ncbi:MAG: hypothetical protein ACJ76M_16755 [Solirubrobacteraceae bacterium]
MQRHAFAAAGEVARGMSAYARLPGGGDWRLVDTLFAAYLVRTGPP